MLKLSEKFNDLSSRLAVLSTAAYISVASALPAMAADFDVTASLTSGAEEMKTVALGVLGVVAPVAIAVLVATGGFKKGLSMFRSIIGH